MKKTVLSVVISILGAGVWSACNNPRVDAVDAGATPDGGGVVPQQPDVGQTDGGRNDGGPLTPPEKDCLWGETANGGNCESGAVELTYLKTFQRFPNQWSTFVGASSALSADGKTLAFSGSGSSRSFPTLDVLTLENNQWTSKARSAVEDTGSFRPAQVALSETGDVCVSILDEMARVSTRNAGVWSRFDSISSKLVSSLAISSNQERIALASPDVNGVTIYRRSTNSWTEEARLQNSFSDTGDLFGSSLAFSADGTTLFVGASGEDGGSADLADNSKKDSGAVYVFELKNALWTRTAYLKAKEGKEGDQFGFSLSVSQDGKTLVVGANGEDSVAKESGAVYVFERSGETEWIQKTVLKAAFPGENDNFGQALAISGNGEFLIVGAPNEDSSAIRLNGNADNNDAFNSGAAYLFHRRGENWIPAGYIKAMNTEQDDLFGTSVAISKEGRHILIGAPGEDGSSVGVNGNLNDNARANSGAVYLYEWKANSVDQ